MMLNGKEYDPNWSSLDSRPTPQWFKDAKFGIFIHWGLYSVPAWGPKGSYAEWYLNGLRSGDSTRIKYHEDNFGKDFPYRGFIDLFKPVNYEPDKWAELFTQCGARYVVLTSKHHDGFCLWPSEQSNGYNSVSGAASRDLLGDLDQAVKDAGLRSGLYYSLYEWDHPDYPENVNDYVNDHMLPQLKDVVQRYQPDIIFSDGEWDRESKEWRSEEFLAWLYNESNAPNDVVVNDRWGGETRFTHGGYYSTEYDPDSDHIGQEFIERGWEECRGIGRSFGYNQNEGPEDYSTSEELIRLLVDIVSRGGNLLLNIGPRSDGTIPKIMVNRLKDMGEWLDDNGEAIYGTMANRVTRSGKVKFTLSKDRRHLFAFIEKIPKKKLTIKGLNGAGNELILLLGKNKKLNWRNFKNSLVIDIPEDLHRLLGSSPVHVLKIPVLPYLDEPLVDIILGEEQAEISISSNDKLAEYSYTFETDVINVETSNKYDGPFKVSQPKMLNVQAYANGYQPSRVVTIPINILNDKNGMIRKTFQGQWETCLEMIEQQPIEEEVVNDLTIDTYRKNHFGHSFSGFILIERDGTYEFQTTSDDGSILIIDGFPVVDNDGLHGRKTVSGDIPLKKGFHRIKVHYFERGGQESLDVKWKGPGFEWANIPAFRLFRSDGQ